MCNEKEKDKVLYTGNSLTELEHSKLMRESLLYMETRLYIKAGEYESYPDWVRRVRGG